MQEVTEFVSRLWVMYGDVMLTCVMWGAIGYIMTLPMSLLQAVYNTVKVGNTYDLYGDYRLEKSRYKREIKLYGLANASVVLALTMLLTR